MHFRYVQTISVRHQNIISKQFDTRFSLLNRATDLPPAPQRASTPSVRNQQARSIRARSLSVPTRNNSVFWDQQKLFRYERISLKESPKLNVKRNCSEIDIFATVLDKKSEAIVFKVPATSHNQLQIREFSTLIEKIKSLFNANTKQEVNVTEETPKDPPSTKKVKEEIDFEKAMKQSQPKVCSAEEKPFSMPNNEKLDVEGQDVPPFFSEDRICKELPNTRVLKLQRDFELKQAALAEKRMLEELAERIRRQKKLNALNRRDSADKKCDGHSKAQLESREEACEKQSSNEALQCDEDASAKKIRSKQSKSGFDKGERLKSDHKKNFTMLSDKKRHVVDSQYSTKNPLVSSVVVENSKLSDIVDQKPTTANISSETISPDTKEEEKEEVIVSQDLEPLEPEELLRDAPILIRQETEVSDEEIMTEKITTFEDPDDYVSHAENEGEEEDSLSKLIICDDIQKILDKSKTSQDDLKIPPGSGIFVPIPESLVPIPESMTINPLGVDDEQIIKDSDSIESIDHLYEFVPDVEQPEVKTPELWIYKEEELEKGIQRITDGEKQAAGANQNDEAKKSDLSLSEKAAKLESGVLKSPFHVQEPICTLKLQDSLKNFIAERENNPNLKPLMLQLSNELANIKKKSNKEIQKLDDVKSQLIDVKEEEEQRRDTKNVAQVAVEIDFPKHSDPVMEISMPSEREIKIEVGDTGKKNSKIEKVPGLSPLKNDKDEVLDVSGLEGLKLKLKEKKTVDGSNVVEVHEVKTEADDKETKKKQNLDLIKEYKFEGLKIHQNEADKQLKETLEVKEVMQMKENEIKETQQDDKGALRSPEGSLIKTKNLEAAPELIAKIAEPAADQKSADTLANVLQVSPLEGIRQGNADSEGEIRIGNLDVMTYQVGSQSIAGQIKNMQDAKIKNTKMESMLFIEQVQERLRWDFGDKYTKEVIQVNPDLKTSTTRILPQDPSTPYSEIYIKLNDFKIMSVQAEVRRKDAQMVRGHLKDQGKRLLSPWQLSSVQKRDCRREFEETAVLLYSHFFLERHLFPRQMYNKRMERAVFGGSKEREKPFLDYFKIIERSIAGNVIRESFQDLKSHFVFFKNMHLFKNSNSINYSERSFIRSSRIFNILYPILNHSNPVLKKLNPIFNNSDSIVNYSKESKSETSNLPPKKSNESKDDQKKGKPKKTGWGGFFSSLINKGKELKQPKEIIKQEAKPTSPDTTKPQTHAKPVPRKEPPRNEKSPNDVIPKKMAESIAEKQMKPFNIEKDCFRKKMDGVRLERKSDIPPCGPPVDKPKEAYVAPKRPCRKPWDDNPLAHPSLKELKEVKKIDLKKKKLALRKEKEERESAKKQVDQKSKLSPVIAKSRSTSEINKEKAKLKINDGPKQSHVTSRLKDFPGKDSVEKPLSPGLACDKAKQAKEKILKEKAEEDKIREKKQSLIPKDIPCNPTIIDTSLLVNPCSREDFCCREGSNKKGDDAINKDKCLTNFERAVMKEQRVRKECRGSLEESKQSDQSVTGAKSAKKKKSVSTQECSICKKFDVLESPQSLKAKKPTCVGLKCNRNDKHLPFKTAEPKPKNSCKQLQPRKPLCPKCRKPQFSVECPKSKKKPCQKPPGCTKKKSAKGCAETTSKSCPSSLTTSVENAKGLVIEPKVEAKKEVMIKPKSPNNHDTLLKKLETVKKSVPIEEDSNLAAKPKVAVVKILDDAIQSQKMKKCSKPREKSEGCRKDGPPIPVVTACEQKAEFAKMKAQSDKEKKEKEEKERKYNKLIHSIWTPVKVKLDDNKLTCRKPFPHEKKKVDQAHVPGNHIIRPDTSEQYKSPRYEKENFGGKQLETKKTCLNTDTACNQYTKYVSQILQLPKPLESGDDKPKDHKKGDKKSGPKS